MKIKIIFDRDKISDKCSSGWGISYLVDETVLFDTGEKGEYLINNLNALGVDVNKIEKVVISHNHWDHRGGLQELLKINKNIEVFACSDFIEEFKDELKSFKMTVVNESQEIKKGIHTTGCIKIGYKGKIIQEQFLVVKTSNGISLLCGCSHPGIIESIKRIKELFPKDKIYAMLGGFHLMDKDMRTIRFIADQVKKMSVERIGPSHCTGYEAENVFKELYGDNYLDIKIGKELDI